MYIAYLMKLHSTLVLCIASLLTMNQANGGLYEVSFVGLDQVTIPESKISTPNDSKVLLFKNLARDAFVYLNEFRSRPAYYGSKIGLDLRNVKNTRALNWDPVLAAAAEEKAYDMAHENFFSHIDQEGYGMNYRVQQKGYLLPPEWTAKQSSNFIESIAANSKDPAHFIDQLITDKGIEGKGHRQHLLAISHFYSNASRIGIAIAYNPNSTYKYYCCILIAPLFANVAVDD